VVRLSSDFRRYPHNSGTNRILRAYEWDRVNFGTPEKRLRIAELWGVSEERLDVIRKNTRDAVVSMLRGGE